MANPARALLRARSTPLIACLVFASATSLLAAKSSAEPPISNSSQFASTTGGVMTAEVGAITGELEVRTRLLKTDHVEVAVRYAGADDWYAVRGSPIPDEPGSSPQKPGGPSRIDELNERIVECLTTPSPTVEGNEKAVSLTGF